MLVVFMLFSVVFRQLQNAAVDENMINCSLILKGDILEDPANEPKKDMYMMTVDPEDAPNEPE